MNETRTITEELAQEIKDEYFKLSELDRAYAKLALYGWIRTKPPAADVNPLVGLAYVLVNTLPVKDAIELCMDPYLMTIMIASFVHGENNTVSQVYQTLIEMTKVDLERSGLTKQLEEKVEQHYGQK